MRDNVEIFSNLSRISRISRGWTHQTRSWPGSQSCRCLFLTSPSRRRRSSLECDRADRYQFITKHGCDGQKPTSASCSNMWSACLALLIRVHRPTTERLRCSVKGRRMISGRSAILSLDGNIESSSAGDLTLTFDDGSSLKTHASLLKLASPVFNTRLTERGKIDTLALEETSKETWIRILDRLHPAVQSLFLDFDPQKETKQLVRRRIVGVDHVSEHECPSRPTFWNSHESSSCTPSLG